MVKKLWKRRVLSVIEGESGEQVEKSFFAAGKTTRTFIIVSNFTTNR